MFGVDKVIGLDEKMSTSSNVYITALDIQELHPNIGYDFVTHIINVMHNEIIASQKGEMRNFKFHHYSISTHIILYKNIGHINFDFIEGTKENGESFPVQL